MKAFRWPLGLLLFATALPWLGGCQQEPLLLESEFDQIVVGQTTAGQVIAMLPEEGMMHTADALSVYREQDYTREAGIVRFSEETSAVLRTQYVNTRSEQSIWFIKENLNVRVKAILAEEVLDEPYDSESERLRAIMRHIRDLMAQDTAPFREDIATESMVAMAGTALGLGLLALDEQPRDVTKLMTEEGFNYRHPTLGSCTLLLRQEAGNAYTLTIQGHSWVDPFTTW